MTFPIVLPDGTKCWTKNCKRHTPQLNTVARNIASSFTGLADWGVPSDVLQEAKLLCYLPDQDTLRKDLTPYDDVVVQFFEEALQNHQNPSLSKEHWGSVQRYKTTAYQKINKYLRNELPGMVLQTAELMSEPQRSEYLAKQREYLIDDYARRDINRISEVFELTRGNRKETRLLYRSISLPQVTENYNLKQYIADHYPIGGIVKDDAFVSTTIDPGLILYRSQRNHLKANQYLVFEMVASDGLNIHNPEEHKKSLLAYEKEVLLPAGKQFKVVNVTKATYTNGGFNPSEVYDLAEEQPEKRTFTVVQLIEV